MSARQGLAKPSLRCVLHLWHRKRNDESPEVASLGNASLFAKCFFTILVPLYPPLPNQQSEFSLE